MKASLETEPRTNRKRADLRSRQMFTRLRFVQVESQLQSAFAVGRAASRIHTWFLKRLYVM
jgi:hypothetical protein